MSEIYIPPFPTDNSSSDTNYTQAFEKARQNRTKPSDPIAPEPVKPKTPSHHNSQASKSKPGNKPANPGYSFHHQGSSGSSKSGSSHNGKKPINQNYPNHPSPKPGRSGREKKSSYEGQTGNYNNSPYNNPAYSPYNNPAYNNNYSPYNNPAYNNNNSPYNNNAQRRNEPAKNKKKQGGQTPLHDGILPPFPTGTDTGSNYTEMFNRYHQDNLSPNAPAMQSYRPTNEMPPHKTKRCCIL